MLSQSHEALDQTGLCPILWLSRELLLPAAAPHHRGLLGYRVWIESDPLLRPDRAAPGQAGQVCKATAQLQYRNRARKTSPRKQDRYAQTHIEHGPGREKQAAQYQQLDPPRKPGEVLGSRVSKRSDGSPHDVLRSLGRAGNRWPCSQSRLGLSQNPTPSPEADANSSKALSPEADCVRGVSVSPGTPTAAALMIALNPAQWHHVSAHCCPRNGMSLPLVDTSSAGRTCSGQSHRPSA